MEVEEKNQPKYPFSGLKFSRDTDIFLNVKMETLKGLGYLKSLIRLLTH